MQLCMELHGIAWKRWSVFLLLELGDYLSRSCCCTEHSQMLEIRKSTDMSIIIEVLSVAGIAHRLHFANIEITKKKVA